jgi:hypothetical protein
MFLLISHKLKYLFLIAETKGKIKNGTTNITTNAQKILQIVKIM